MFVYSRSSDHIPSTVEDIMVEMLQYACPEFATIAECTAPHAECTAHTCGEPKNR